jgi:hypothetical protein
VDRRREGYLASLQIQPAKFTLFRCTSAELLFSCRDSVAALRATASAPRSSTCGAQRAAPREEAWVEQVPATNNERRCGQRPGRHDQVPATHNELRRRQRPGHHDQVPAAPRASAWAQRSSTCDAQRGNGLGRTITYSRRTTSGAAGGGLSRYRGVTD